MPNDGPLQTHEPLSRFRGLSLRDPKKRFWQIGRMRYFELVFPPVAEFRATLTL